MPLYFRNCVKHLFRSFDTERRFVVIDIFVVTDQVKRKVFLAAERVCSATCALGS